LAVPEDLRALTLEASMITGIPSANVIFAGGPVERITSSEWSAAGSRKLRQIQVTSRYEWCLHS
jgi:hypothetical protein